MEKNHKDVVKNPSFCSLAWTGISISPTGTTTPCCLMESSIKNNEDKSFRIYESNVKEIYNSDYMKSIRTQMLKGELISACQQCYNNEAHGGISLRKQVNNDPLDCLESYSDTKEYYPSYIDLKLNNKCNLKCRMCQPQDSNLIYKEFTDIHTDNTEFKYFQNTSLKDHEFQIDVNQLPSWESGENFLFEFENLLPKLKKISLVGGEPLILEETFYLLDLAVKKGYAKDIFLCVTTNLATTQSKKIRDYFPFFKKVLILISFDGTDKALNYIRFPSKQEVVLKNLRYLNESPNAGVNTRFSFALTIQAYNALYLYDIFKLTDDLLDEGIKFNNLPISFTYLTYPEHLNIRILPHEIRLIAISKLEAYLELTKNKLRHSYFEREVLQIIGTLRSDYLNNSKILMGNFLYYTNLLDKKRGHRFQDFLPELCNEIRKLDLKEIKPTPNVHQIREEGWALASENKLIEAIKKFQTSSRMTEDNFLDFREMAWMMLTLGKLDDAIQSYEEAFAKNPNDKYVAKGIFHSYLSKKNFNEASKYYKIALKLNPDDKSINNHKDFNEFLILKKI